MKFKTNIPALFMALLVFLTSNGFALSVHICNTSHTRNFAFFTAADCGMKKQDDCCCPEKNVKKKGCCEHKQFFKKLPIEGFTVAPFILKPFNKIVCDDFLVNSFQFHHQVDFDRYITGIPPPDNLYTIKYLLRPTPVELQIFRC